MHRASHAVQGGKSRNFLLLPSQHLLRIVFFLQCLLPACPCWANARGGCLSLRTKRLSHLQKENGEAPRSPILFFSMTTCLSICSDMSRREIQEENTMMIGQREEQVRLRLPLSSSHIELAVTAFREQFHAPCYLIHQRTCDYCHWGTLRNPSVAAGGAS